MRKRFEQQLSLNLFPIDGLQINIKNKDAATKIPFALLELYKNPTYNEGIEKIWEIKFATLGW